MANLPSQRNSIHNTNSRRQMMTNEEHLDDSQETEFTGATLTITPENDPSPPTSGADSNISSTTAEDRNANIKPDGNKAENLSWQQNSDQANAEDTEGYFAYRDGAFEKAVDSCRPVILEVLDGQLRGAWLLTEIDHWDVEKERLVLLTDLSLLIIKYDFITLRILSYRRLHLRDLDVVIQGEIKYPENSLVPKINMVLSQVKGFMLTRLNRQQAPSVNPSQSVATVAINSRPRNAAGVRAMWNKGNPIHFTKNWNPWSRDIPYITFTNHRLFYHKSRETRNFDVEQFSNNLLQAIRMLDNPPCTCVIEQRPIIIENYMGLASVFHNINDLGFFKARGRVSF